MMHSSLEVTSLNHRGSGPAPGPLMLWSHPHTPAYLQAKERERDKMRV